MSHKQRILTSEAVLEQYGDSLAGKTILITGVAEDSIAGALALALARSRAKPSLLILSGRSSLRVRPIISQIEDEQEANHDGRGSIGSNGSSSMAVRFLPMDLSDLDDVRRAVQEDLADIKRIDHVVAVAGVMVPPWGRTKQGVEMQFGVNYLANFLLVKMLLPKMEEAKGEAAWSSVVICASAAVRTARLDFEDVNFGDGKTYDASTGYARSNVARVMFAKLLAEKLKHRKIKVFSIDPGGVRTKLHRHFTPEYLAWLGKMMESNTPLRDIEGRHYPMPPITSASEGAATLVTAMADPTVAASTGSYLHNNAVADEELHSHVVDRENWARLWGLSERMIGEEFVI